MLTPHDIDQLYTLYSSQLLRYLASGTGDPSLAQDLLHDSFLELCQRSHVIEMTDDILALLYTIAGRNLTDHYRRCNENASRHDIYSEESHGCVYHNYEDRMEIIRACDRLLELPDLLRLTMYRYIGGAGPRVQADQDGVKEGTVRVRMHRARRLLVVTSQGSQGQI